MFASDEFAQVLISESFMMALVDHFALIYDVKAASSANIL